MPFEVFPESKLAPIAFRQLPRCIFLSFLANLAIAGPACAQQQTATGEQPPNVLDGRGAWDLGAFLGGGTGAGKSSDTHFLFAGGRVGRVLTPDFGGNFLHGNFEYAVEVMPVYTVFTPSGAVYGASIKPIILRWNFTSNRRVIPLLPPRRRRLVHYVRLFLRPTLPSINFTPQLGGGIHWFVRPERSVGFRC